MSLILTFEGGKHNPHQHPSIWSITKEQSFPAHTRHVWVSKKQNRVVDTGNKDTSANRQDKTHISNVSRPDKINAKKICTMFNGKRSLNSPFFFLPLKNTLDMPSVGAAGEVALAVVPGKWPSPTADEQPATLDSSQGTSPSTTAEKGTMHRR